MGGFKEMLFMNPKCTIATFFGTAILTLTWGETWYFNHHTSKLNYAYVFIFIF
jgi:hypothetical protein